MIEEVTFTIPAVDSGIIFNCYQDAAKLAQKERNNHKKLEAVLFEMRRFEHDSNSHPYIKHNFPTNDGTLVTFKPE